MSVADPDILTQALLAAIPALTGVYLFCLIVGGGMLLISTVLGGSHDADVDIGTDLDVAGDVEMGGGLDADADLDVDAADTSGAHHGATSALALSKWFSVRFLVYFAAMFGLVGTVLTYMTAVQAGWVFAIALVAGGLMGQFVHQVVRALQRGEVSSEVRVEDLVARTARVTIAVRPPARGEIGVRVGDREVFLAAVAQRPDDAFEIGAQVRITAYSGGLAQVVSCREYEFTHPAE